MIATRHFVFLHLHKSGGTFVNEWLLRFFPDSRQVGYHLPRRLIPRELAGLPVIGLVRNPWSYYVSWYAFQSGLAQPNALFQILSEDRTVGFDGTIRNMLALGSSSAHLDRLIAALPPSRTGRGLNLPGPELAAIRGTGLGFYSFLYRYMYAGDGPLQIARMEQMREELPSIVRALGESISAPAQAHMAVAPASNASRHAPYAQFYDPALRDFVGERDGELIRLHGYQFGK